MCEEIALLSCTIPLVREFPYALLLLCDPEGCHVAADFVLTQLDGKFGLACRPLGLKIGRNGRNSLLYGGRGVRQVP